MQIIILPSSVPPDQEQEYVDIFKHIYLHRNKVLSADCVSYCQGIPIRFDWGNQVRVALSALNYMLDRAGGMQVRLWTLSPKFEKKATMDQSARESGYRFIRDHGPRSNNRNQFMEWTDDQVHLPGGPLEGWPEGKVKEALHNYYRGRQNAKTIEYWPLTIKSFAAWFLDGVLVKMLPTMHAATFHHLARAYSSWQVFRLQDHLVCPIQVRDHTSRSSRSCAFHRDCKALRLLQGRAHHEVQAGCL